MLELFEAVTYTACMCCYPQLFSHETVASHTCVMPATQLLHCHVNFLLTHTTYLHVKLPQVALPSSYQTMKGKMTGIVGASWEMYESLTSIGWSAVTGVDPVALQTGGRLHDLSSALAHDIALQHPVAPDVYGFGKQVSWQLVVPVVV
jgi:hypothetical protein